MARNRGVKKIDNLSWLPFSAAQLAFGAGAAAINIVSAGILPQTIMRWRGNLFAGIDVLSGPGKLIQLAVGFILVPEGTGTTVLWSPITDVNAPWMYYETFLIGYEEGVTDVIDYPGYSTFRSVIDGKAMRRLRADVEVQAVFENATIGTGGAANIGVFGRVLMGN